jgi:hypothetical protein
MRVINVALSAAFILSGVNGIGLEKKATPKVFKIPLHRKSPELLSKNRKRAGEVETPDINYQRSLLYIVELVIGTPPQTTFVQLDTGSSDLTVETSKSDICNTAPPNPCTNFGSCWFSLRGMF